MVSSDRVWFKLSKPILQQMGKPLVSLFTATQSLTEVNIAQRHIDIPDSQLPCFTMAASLPPNAQEAS